MNMDKLLATNTKDNKTELGYDLMDDLVFFMNNDPDFYRKRYYPTMLKFDKFCKSHRKVSPRGFANLVNEAYEIYRNKFQVEGLEPKLTAEMCEKICKHIHEQETENCKEGMYDER